MYTKSPFDEYLINIYNTEEKLHYNFLGINRKDYPKWEGWKIISIYKEEGINIKDINDSKLDVLVKNHYYIEYIKKMLM